MFDPTAFDPSRVDAETIAVNADIVARLEALPDQWLAPPAVIRANRLKGLGAFPVEPESQRAEVLTIEGRGGPVPLRVIAPEKPTGIYLHIHGGGWILGVASEQDPRHEHLADTLGLACVSVDYRLAPEAPYPAAPDDCEVAALWLVREGTRRFGTDRLLIGGESAGAHLSAVTLLRLRDRHGLTPFRGANLVAGAYDLGFTPSVRRWGEEKLVLNTRDIFMFVQNFLRLSGDVRDPDVSPIHADLTGLPPALFTVGTRDPLVDDTLFMAARWMAAGNSTAVEIAPGACHSHVRLKTALARRNLALIDAFLAAA